MAPIWTPPLNWVLGSAARSADMNTYVSGNLTYLSTPPSFSASQNVYQSVPNATLETIQLNDIVNDPYAGWQPASYAWKAPESGLYLLCGLVAFASGATGNAWAYLGLNGVNVKPGPSQVFASGCSVGVTGLVRCNASDLLSLMVDQTSGAAEMTAPVTYLDIIWVSF